MLFRKEIDIYVIPKRNKHIGNYEEYLNTLIKVDNIIKYPDVLDIARNHAIYEMKHNDSTLYVFKVYIVKRFRFIPKWLSRVTYIGYVTVSNRLYYNFSKTGIEYYTNTFNILKGIIGDKAIKEYLYNDFISRQNGNIDISKSSPVDHLITTRLLTNDAIEKL